MKRTSIIICTAAWLLACNSEDKKAEATKDDTKVASLSTDKSSEAWVPVDTATANKAWMDFMTPGEPHAMLAKSNGEWEGEMTMWMAPGAPAETSRVSTTNKMIMDGRYQVSTNKGMVMGMPFEGTGTTGYDNAKKLYVTSWVDNAGTGILHMEGPWDAATKSINFKGKMLCMANHKECEVREVYKIVDDNTHLMEMYGPDMATGKEYKTMEIKFTRRK